MMNLIISTLYNKQAELGYSDYRLAKILGLNQSTLSLLKNGHRNPGLKVLRAIDKAFPELDIFNVSETEAPAK
ncbi:MAG: helix-turn-helix transcriptional regulator [Dehalogenimonas sp.]|nr:helix-turn-helix transcriptional regulator [Dehalogenimonas sp.]